MVHRSFAAFIMTVPESRLRRGPWRHEPSTSRPHYSLAPGREFSGHTWRQPRRKVGKKEDRLIGRSNSSPARPDDSGDLVIRCDQVHL